MYVCIKFLYYINKVLYLHIKKISALGMGALPNNTTIAVFGLWFDLGASLMSAMETSQVYLGFCFIFQLHIISWLNVRKY